MQQVSEAAFFPLFIPGWSQRFIARFNRLDYRGRVARFIYRQEYVVAVLWKIAPARGPLFIHGERVAVHPETVQNQVAAEFIPVLIFARLQAFGDLRVRGRFLAKIAPDDSRELL